jgi:hypothetical protein
MPASPKIQPDGLEEFVLDEQAEGGIDEQGEDGDEDDESAKRKRRRKSRRWGTRTEAMIYARIGSTMLNELMRDRKIIAKKAGTKVIIDLDSLDDHLDSLPDAADTKVSAASTAA